MDRVCGFGKAMSWLSYLPIASPRLEDRAKNRPVISSRVAAYGTGKRQLGPSILCSSDAYHSLWWHSPFVRLHSWQCAGLMLSLLSCYSIDADRNWSTNGCGMGYIAPSEVLICREI